MKVSSNTTPASTASEKRSSSNEVENLAGVLESEGLSEKPRFANVLDRVTHSHRESKSKPEAETPNEPSSIKPAPTKRKDKEDTEVVSTTSQIQFGESLALTQVAPDASAILQTADLEKMVAACRVALVAGHPEVQLDLAHSVLEGLQVKLRVDSLGKITTEFLTANEGVKTLLDSRSSELIALLRSRGIDQVNFKSSLSLDTHTSNSGSERQRDRTLAAIENYPAASSREPEVESNAATEIALGATYRA